MYFYSYSHISIKSLNIIVVFNHGKLPEYQIGQKWMLEKWYFFFFFCKEFGCEDLLNIKPNLEAKEYTAWNKNWSHH